MKKIELFDPALCCNSGVCGTDIDQTLVTFAADMDWLKQQGVTIFRYNLAQQPLVFAENPVVHGFLHRFGETGLPLILVDGEIVLAGRYPTRNELLIWVGIKPIKDETMPSTGCCGSSVCC